jgi:hypothetical protein
MHGDFRIAIPEDAASPAFLRKALGPSSRIKVVQTIERHKPNRYCRLGAALGGLGVTVRADQVSVCCRYILHQTSKLLYLLHIYLALPILCLDDDPPRIIGVVSGVDQDVDLAASLANPPSKTRVGRHAVIRRDLIRNHAGDHPLVQLPVG